MLDFIGVLVEPGALGEECTPRTCLCLCPFTWVLGICTVVLRLVQQALHSWSHLPVLFSKILTSDYMIQNNTRNTESL